MFRFRVLAIVVAVSTAAAAGKFAASAEETPHSDYAPLTRIAFGSCANQQEPCPIWGTIADYQPDLLLLLGDNVYADIVNGRLKSSTPERIQQAYDQLASLPDFARLRREVPIMATWDDHDYGNNDAGVEWEHKEAAAKLFHDFFATPADSPRRQRKGVYDAKVFGPPGKRVQVIMLDTRYFRSELEKAAEPQPPWRAKPYVAAFGPEVTMLGEEQWHWLQQQLQEPAELRIVASSIQLLSDEHPFEKWSNFPQERERFFELIRERAASGVVVVSGDRHLGEISLDTDAIGYPLYDVTASGLNQASLQWRAPEPNRKRVASLAYGNHFGAIEIDWRTEEPAVHLQLRHEDGAIAVQSRVPLSALQAGPPSLPRPTGVASAVEASQMAEGAEVTVQFIVAGGRVISDEGLILLNSQSDFRSERNFTVVVSSSARPTPVTDADLQSFLNQTIRASGTISHYNTTKQLRVEQEHQLEIVPPAD
jgi:alkaline phosphatase D